MQVHKGTGVHQAPRVGDHKTRVETLEDVWGDHGREVEGEGTGEVEMPEVALEKVSDMLL